ncbi:hypothetical protein HY524_01260 [Candidatus Berkelbacteria bacterium]|nr:hypothetical protein [Candidatus Berkelbacteria bacterium]
MKPYLYFQGLLDLAQEVDGSETIHVGIRPYGFHAGNTVALVIYPLLFCKYVQQAGTPVRFTFIVSINDWEQDALTGPDFRRYPFNIQPSNTTIYYLPDEEGCCASLIDHWQPRIEQEMRRITDQFPNVTLKFIRNSMLIDDPFSRQLLIRTITHPREFFELFKANSDKETLDAPIQYATATCPVCHSARGETVCVDADTVTVKCVMCQSKTTGRMEDFQYWWYHKPLLLARLKAFDVQLTLSGGDHFTEGDFNIRRALIERYAPSYIEPRMLFTPTLIAENGQKMSKSRNNTRIANTNTLLATLDGFMGEELQITESLALPEII